MMIIWLLHDFILSNIQHKITQPELITNGSLLLYCQIYSMLKLLAWPSCFAFGSWHFAYCFTHVQSFDGKSNAKIKQQGVSCKVIDYKSITDTKWTEFAKLCDDDILAENSFSNPTDFSLSTSDDINTLWNHLSNVIMRSAYKNL